MFTHMQSGKVFRLWEIFVSKPSAGKKKKSALAGLPYIGDDICQMQVEKILLYDITVL